MPDEKISAMTELSSPPPPTAAGLMVPVIREGDSDNYRVPAQLLLDTPAQPDGSGDAGTETVVKAGDADALGTSLAGGALTLGGGNSAGTTGVGGDVDIVPGTGTAVNGRVTVNGNASVIAYNHAWIGGFNPSRAILLVAARPMIVTAVMGRLGLAEGGAATLALYKAPSGTAIGSGTALTTTTFNANGTANANQTLTLDAAPVTTLAAGDAVGIVTTGAWTTSYGTISLWLTFGPA